MVSARPEPRKPDANTATQRDIAVYITQLRAWGRTMKIQLDTAKKVLEEHDATKNSEP